MSDTEINPNATIEEDNEPNTLKAENIPLKFHKGWEIIN
jgi:hypothetical protein